jgi:hypothetical protein
MVRTRPELGCCIFGLVEALFSYLYVKADVNFVTAGLWSWLGAA